MSVRPGIWHAAALWVFVVGCLIALGYGVARQIKLGWKPGPDWSVDGSVDR